MSTPDPVERARAWLTGHTETSSRAGQPAAVSRDIERPDVSAGPNVGGGARRRAPVPERAEPLDTADRDADPEGVARTIALRKLTASARTRHELDQALKKKNVPDEVAGSVLDRLEAVGLLDDEAFAQSWVESRQQRRHLSRTALRRELQAKGVDRDHVDAALATVDAEDELAAARALAAKKSAGMRRLDPTVRNRRLVGVLARRGFSTGIIATVLAELGEERATETGA